MKRLVVFVIAAASSWWGYRKLRSHPLTTHTLSELEGQSQRIVHRASVALRSGKNQAVSKAVDMGEAAATRAQGAIDTASDKARGALDAAAHKARQAVSPVQENVSEVQGEASGKMTEPHADLMPAEKTPAA